MQRRVRSAARWHGWIWLALAVATPAFLLGTRAGQAGRGVDSFWVAVGFMVLGLVLWALDARHPVRGRTTARVDDPATWAYVAAMVVVSVVTIAVDPDGLPAWYVVLSVLPALPAVVAGWLVLRA